MRLLAGALTGRAGGSPDETRAPDAPPSHTDRRVAAPEGAVASRWRTRVLLSAVLATFACEVDDGYGIVSAR